MNSIADFEDLLRVKSFIDHPRHQEDARVLRQILAQRPKSGQ